MTRISTELELTMNAIGEAARQYMRNPESLACRNKARRTLLDAGQLARGAHVEKAAQQALEVAIAASESHPSAVHLEWVSCEFRLALSSLTRQQSRSGGRLVLAAARIIPLAERARYLEEFEAELVEIGEGWRRRVGYGLRVLGRAVPLRWELRRPVRERAR